QRFDEGAPLARTNLAPATRTNLASVPPANLAPAAHLAPVVRSKPSDPRSAALMPRTPLPRPRPVNVSVATPTDATQTVPPQATTGGSQQSSGTKPEASAGKSVPALPPVTPLD